MADTDVKTLLEAGSHFGHQTRRWNPKMRPFIFGVRGGVHIIDLTKTVEYLDEAKKFAHKVAADGGKVLFVGTKRQAAPIVKAEAEAVKMPYVSERWLGGMLTNFRTIAGRVKRLLELEAGLESGELASKYNKKEVADLAEEAAGLRRLYGGIAEMNELPHALFVVDAVRDDIAVAEARTLGIPVIAIADSNANPDLIAHPIPANDDAIKSIRLITHDIAEAAAAGAAEYAKKAKEEPTEKAEAPSA